MKKMNKKGFTLIEMLVVIAIIAILVAIIIPTVLQSNTKAKAAADAANLRSVIAEATTAWLSYSPSADDTDAFKKPDSGTKDIPTDWYTKVTSESGDGTLKVVMDDTGKITAYFGKSENDVAHYAKLAGQ